MSLFSKKENYMPPQPRKPLVDAIIRKRVPDTRSSAGRETLLPVPERAIPYSETVFAEKMPTGARLQESAEESFAESAIIVSDPPHLSEETDMAARNIRGEREFKALAASRIKLFLEKFWGKKHPPEQVLSEEMRTSKIRFVWWGMASGLAAMGLLVFLLSTSFAQVTVTIKPRVDTLNIDEVTASIESTLSQLSAVERRIPGEYMEFKKSAREDFEATGKEFIEEKARGTVKIFNNFSSSPQSLVATTRFLAESGILFRTPAAVTIPGARVEGGKIVPQLVVANLTADKAGDESNIIGEVTLRIPGFQGSAKYNGFYAVATEGFSGGFRGEARVVSKVDRKTAEEMVTKRAYDGVREEVALKIPPEFKLLDSLRQIELSEVAVPVEKTRAEKFSASAEARAHALVFREKDVITVVKDHVLKGDQKRDFVDDAVHLEYQVKNTDFDKGKAHVAIRGNAKTQMIIPQDEIAALVKGRKEGSVVEVLRGRSDLTSFRITFFPFWLSRVPADTRKIKFIIEAP